MEETIQRWKLYEEIQNTYCSIDFCFAFKSVIYFKIGTHLLHTYIYNKVAKTILEIHKKQKCSGAKSLGLSYLQ